MPNAQARITVLPFTVVAGAVVPNVQARITVLPFTVVAGAAVPRRWSARVNLSLQVVAAGQLTIGGIARGFIRFPLLQVAASASSQVYDVRIPRAYGQPTYGVQQLPSGVSRLIFPLSELGMPTTIAAGSAWTSGPIDCLGLRHLTWGLQATQPIILAVNRYVDPSCQSSIGAAVTATAVANTAVALDNNDGKGYSGFTLGFTNTAASVATLSSYSIMLESS